jgi:hypothetical protein
VDEHAVEWIAFPPCRRCGDGDLVPLSDFGVQGAEVRYKAWVCTNPACGFNLKIRNGEVVVDEPVTDAAGVPHVPHVPPPRSPMPPARRPTPGPGHDGVGRGR